MLDCRNLLDNEEIGLLKTALESDEGVLTQAYQRDDGMGRTAKIVLWNHPGNDITGTVARTEKVAGTFEKVLGQPIFDTVPMFKILHFKKNAKY